MLQGSSGFHMETTPHITIINRKTPKAPTTKEDQDVQLINAISSFSIDHDYLGLLTITDIQVTRQVIDLKTKDLKHFPIWRMAFE